MINKKTMNYIKTELRKSNELLIKYQPTKEEIEYLAKYNIITSIVVVKHKGLISGYYYDVEYCKYEVV